MKKNTVFYRKVGYIAAIVLLILPLSWLSKPSTMSSSGEMLSGGKLAQLREENDLAQANLGEVDPAGESMKLATLGMRGPAVNILWMKANRYKKVKDWDNFAATLNQITKLQPNFIKVWEFQSHNLTYNISTEFDNYEHRYVWVRKGIEFLITGYRYNQKEPRMLWNIGWYFGPKMGRADEHVQFRRLLRRPSESDFHNMLDVYINMENTLGPDQRPDNWLISHEWFDKAQKAVDSNNYPLRGKSPLIFHSEPTMALFNYSEAIESEGVFGEVAELAWKRAGNAWTEYGDRQILTSWGHTLRLNDFEIHVKERDKLQKEFEALAPGARDRLYKARWEKLTQRQRDAYSTPLEERTPELFQDGSDASRILNITNEDILAEVSPKNQKKADRIHAQLRSEALMARRIDQYRTNVNFNYWRTRAEVEQSKTASKARKHLYDAENLLSELDLEGAREQFELAWDEWAIILEKHPQLMEALTADELSEYVIHYFRMMIRGLDVDEDEVLENFKLKSLMHKMQLPESLRPGQSEGEPTP